MRSQMEPIVQAGLRQERKLELIANHLANVDTAGFKADILSYSSSDIKINQDCSSSYPPCPDCSPCEENRTMRILNPEISVDFLQGDIRHTGNTFDIALEDEGFFKIMTQQGVRYTRNGSFTLDNNGSLVTQNGDAVLGRNGRITIAGRITEINSNGEIIVDKTPLDSLDVVTFEDLRVLQKEGSSLFKSNSPLTKEIIPDNILVKQGALERPNVFIVTEMTKMIETNRMYEAYQKVIQSFDEMDSKAINEIGKA